jgi:hypothetical protein
MARILLALNNPVFQQTWFSLDRQEALAVLTTMRKLSRMEWEALYRDKGLRWEAIVSRSGPHGQRIYSLRITQRIRAVAYREGDLLRFLSLHCSHDSVYA